MFITKGLKKVSRQRFCENFNNLKFAKKMQKLNEIFVNIITYEMNTKLKVLRLRMENRIGNQQKQLLDYHSRELLLQDICAIDEEEI